MLSGLEIQEALRAFAKRWAGYAGSERSEAQTFLNELFACYGTSRQGVGALFEDFKSSAGFIELVERLTELNRQISAGERDYHPFPDPDELG